MRVAPLVASVLLMACKSDPQPAVGPRPTDLTAARQAGLAACAGALAAPRSTALDGGLAALLGTCTPCGVSWQPLLALSTTDPDADEPGALPGPEAVLAVLDACQASCSGSARSQLVAALRTAQLGKSPSAPWRRLAETCPGALRVDAHTRRFARGTWYALDQLARALWRDDVPPEVAAARDAAALEFPLPPFSEASTALALPRVAHLGAWSPRLHITITAGQLHVGALPFAHLRDGAIALVPADQDHPGVEVTLDGLADQVARAIAARGEPAGADDRRSAPALIAPRGMPAGRLVEVLARLPGARPYLAATPRDRDGLAWPEPVGVIPIIIGAAPPRETLPHLDLVGDAALATQLATLPAGATAVRITFAATATIGDVAAALDVLAARSVTHASLTVAAPAGRPP